MSGVREVLLAGFTFCNLCESSPLIVTTGKKASEVTAGGPPLSSLRLAAGEMVSMDYRGH